MTLDTTVRRVNYQGDDRTTCFSFPFKVWGEEQVVVYCSDPATPWTETNITQQTTVTLNADNYGGAVVFANPPASGSNLAIVREGSFLQEDEYLSGSRFDAHEIEDRFDEDAAERQELLDATARSIKVPNSSTQTPEEVYEELLAGSAFVNNALAELNEKIDQANYWYNIIIQEIGNVIYTAAHEVSFIVSETHIVDGDDGEGDWVCSIPNGFTYYPDTHQLLVTVDGLALTPGEHFDEVGDFGTESRQIRFKINMYQGQQVYIKAMFLGTEEFNVKLGEMDDKIADANSDLQDAVNAANKDFEDRTNTLNDLIEEATENFQAIIDGLDEEIAQTEALIQDALEIVGTAENWETFQDAIAELNGIYSTFTSNELPTQGYCELDSGYYSNSCLTMPEGVCYFKGTNTLHLAIDGLVLSPKYFEEVGGCICTPPLVEGGLQETIYYGANFVKIPEGICLYQGQELHAWTESFWGREGWEPEEYQPDITTRLYATSTPGCIYYYSDDLGRCWRSGAAELQDDTDDDENNTYLYLCDHGLYLTISNNEGGSEGNGCGVCWGWDGVNWNCGCGIPNNACLCALWKSEHLPFFVDEPVTELEPMSPAAGLEDEDNGTNDGEQDDDSQGEGSEENGEGGNGSSESQEKNQNGSGVATAFISPVGEDSSATTEHCFLWGPISPTYQLKSDLCFDGRSIPVHITIDQTMAEGTGANNSHGNGATIAIYKSDTYQRLTRDDLNIENNDSTATEQGGWCEFARYEATGPIAANTELYTCFTTAGQNGSGEATVEDESETESYPTCWPTGYYAAAIYNVYGGCSLQSSIPKVNFYVNRKERYSSCAAGTEPDDTTGTEGETND